MRVVDQYIGSALKTITDSRFQKALTARFDVQGCGKKLPRKIEECIFLMSYSMYVEKKDDLVPYLVDLGVDCCCETCDSTESIASSGSGLFHVLPGRYMPLIGVAGETIGCGCVGVIGASGGSGTGSSGTVLTPEQIINWNQAFAAIPPGDLEYIIGEILPDGEFPGPVEGEATFSHPLFMGWEIRMFRGHIIQSKKDDGSGQYFTKPIDSDTLTLTGSTWVIDELVQFQFYRPAKTLTSDNIITSGGDVMQTGDNSNIVI